ncbi:hypothetical protein EGJ34_17155 [Stenotrophomonas sp. 278]|nr:hypothetical protein EGJ34_17155 [Stenotrophomonas sp. 278]
MRVPHSIRITAHFQPLAGPRMRNMRMMHRGLELHLVVDPVAGGFLATVVLTWPEEADLKTQVQEFGPFESIIQAINEGAIEARIWADTLIDGTGRL